MVAGLQEVLALQVIDARRVDGRPGGTDLALGEELTRLQRALRVGLLAGRRGTLHATHLDGIATQAARLRGGDIGAAIRHGAGRSLATQLLRRQCHVVQNGRLATGIRSEKSVDDHDSYKDGTQTKHLLLRELHRSLLSRTDKFHAEVA